MSSEPSPAWAFHRATSNPPWPYPPQLPRTAAGAVVDLPERLPLRSSLGKTLAARSSCRRFSSTGLSSEQLATVLEAGYGVHGHAELDGFGFDVRPVPSAGAKYPLFLRLFVHCVEGLEPGTYCYLPARQGLQRTGPAVRPSAVADVFLGQPYVAGAGAVVVLVGALGQTMSRYGDRGYRYVLFEAGHVAQNLILAATAVGLGSLNLGGFYDQALGEMIGADEPGHVPLYGLALGTPLPGDPREVFEPSAP